MRLAAVVLALAALAARIDALAPPTVQSLALSRGGGAPSLEDGVDASLELIEARDLDGAEALLLDLRMRDARRADMPPALRRAFRVLYEARRDADGGDPGPCDALAALGADAEDWEAVHAACVEGLRRGGDAPLRRALKLRAARSTWRAFSGGAAAAAAEAAEADALVDAGAVAPFAALSLPVSGAAAARAGRRALDAAAARAAAAVAAAAESGDTARAPRRAGGRRRRAYPEARAEGALSVAFLTPDANGAHPLSQLLPSALLALDDGAVGNVVLVTLCADDGSPERRRYEAAADVIIDGHDATPLAISRALASMDIDALVDVCGHAGSDAVVEVVAHGPARVSVAGALGTPAPMGGGPLYAYGLCDGAVAPARLKREAGWADDEHAALRMPTTYFVGDAAAYKRHDLAARDARTARAAHALPEGALVLCCMNRPHKVDAERFDAWVAILEELARPTDGSAPLDVVLWLYAPVAGNGGESLRDRALARAAAALPGGAEEARRRLVFADRAPRPAHLERLRHADVALDTRAYNSHTLAADYAWCGVPMVTSLGDDEPRWASRVGASVAAAAARDGAGAAGVAGNWGAGYVTAAVRLCRDADLRRATSLALKRGRVDAPLWSARRWAESLERGLKACVARAAAGDAPADVDVPPLVDSAHCIVLESAPRRVANFRALLDGGLSELKRVKATDGANAREVADALDDLGVRLATDVWQPTIGQVACLCSHVKLWRRFAVCPKPHFVVLEDDAVLPAGPDALRRAVADVVGGPDFDVCYLYVYPDHWPAPPRDQGDGPVKTTRGFRTWCLLAYAVSKAGAAKLKKLVETEEIYAPIDCMVADWGQRGLLNVRCVDAVGFVDNAGQLDMRVPAAGALASNIWGTADFQPRGALRERVPPNVAHPGPVDGDETTLEGPEGL